MNQEQNIDKPKTPSKNIDLRIFAFIVALVGGLLSLAVYLMMSFNAALDSWGDPQKVSTFDKILLFGLPLIVIILTIWFVRFIEKVARKK